jgi:hypothetical protein
MKDTVDQAYGAVPRALADTMGRASPTARGSDLSELASSDQGSLVCCAWIGAHTRCEE